VSRHGGIAPAIRRRALGGWPPVRRSVRSPNEAVLAILQPDDFFGEGGMAGQLVRKGTATAITPATLLVIEKTEMIRVLHAYLKDIQVCVLASLKLGS
jgi:CRP-like cAMP-binding protein